MPRFYFHLFDGSPCIDDEGLELADAAAARSAALQSARSIMGHDIFKGTLSLRGSVNIADESGEVFDWITFSEAVELETSNRMAGGPDPIAALDRTAEASPTADGTRAVRANWSLQALLLRPQLVGLAAIAVAILAVVLPTLIRLAVDGAVSGTAFSPYLPFVLVSALLLRPAAAFATVLCSAIVADYFFMEPYFRLAVGADDLFGMAVFFMTSGMAILAVTSVRRLFAIRNTSAALMTPERKPG